jgi:glutathione synthase/RimK-type ligase-like ATP-grasp enzyme
MITATTPEPPNWPRPFIVQEFIRLERPEVYRRYAAGGELFGWVARRFPAGESASPWVAHARGARYVRLDEPPPGADEAARAALVTTGLMDSFGCVDLLRRPSGEWLVLEVGTDGIFNHVDREVGDPALEAEIERRLARAFRRWSGRVTNT